MAEPSNISRKWVKNTINDFIGASLLNTMEDSTGEPAWDQALIGFASGADPLWQQYKEYVGAFHWTPWEVFNQHLPEENVSAHQLTVISWVLPQRKPVREANKKQKNILPKNGPGSGCMGKMQHGSETSSGKPPGCAWPPSCGIVFSIWTAPAADALTGVLPGPSQRQGMIRKNAGSTWPYPGNMSRKFMDLRDMDAGCAGSRSPVNP